MHVVIESAVGGNVAGYLQCTISGSETLGGLIAIYCEHKGIPVNPDFVLRDQKGVTLDSRKTVQHYNIQHEDTLYLESQDMQNGIFRFMNWWLLAAGAVFLAVCGFATVISLHLTTGPTPTKYGVVLDGGSSHTALFVYQWDGPKWMGTGVLKQIGVCQIKGDIGSLYKNISGVDPFLSPCLEYAATRVPSPVRPSTPILFGATAGLRLLNLSQPNAAQVLLDGIRNRLSRSGFQFDPSYVEILSGKEEAQFSWITVNAQLHHLGPNDSITGYQTVGALDLGGASTQISLQIPAKLHGQTWLSRQSDRWIEDDISSLQLYGRNYSVYSQSSLCYGVLEIVKRYHSMLIAGSTEPRSPVASPCQPIGYAGIVRAEDVFNSPCALNRSASWTLNEWTVNGTSDYRQCSAIVERLFNKTDCQSHFFPPTCFDNRNQPSVDHQDLLAFSSFNIMAMDMNITNATSLQNYRQTVQRVCNMTWSQVLDLPLTVPNNSFVPLLCLESQYVLSLLTSGYGIDDVSWKGIRFVGQISEADVGWSMGYMTERTNRIAAVEASILMDNPLFAVLAILFSLLLLVGLVISYHAARMKRSANSYSRALLLRLDDEMERFLPINSVD